LQFGRQAPPLPENPEDRGSKFLSTKLHSRTSQKMVIFIMTGVKTSELKFIAYVWMGFCKYIQKSITSEWGITDMRKDLSLRVADRRRAYKDRHIALMIP
jgi:hypothetical protein